MNLSKLLKWGASFVRLAILKVVLGDRVSWPRGGKPVYVGRGARIRVAEGGHFDVGCGTYLSENCLVQVNRGAAASVGDFVFMNASSRIVVAEHLEVGDGAMLGPNVCVYDHDHVVGPEGVTSELASAPVTIGSRAWVGANSVVTKGVALAPRVVVGGVCRHPLARGAGRLRRFPRASRQGLRCAGRVRERWA